MVCLRSGHGRSGAGFGVMVCQFHDMTDLARPVRRELAAAFMVSRPVVTRRMVSRDGTIKWLLRFPDGNEAETVYIPEDDRGTLYFITGRVHADLHIHMRRHPKLAAT